MHVRTLIYLTKVKWELLQIARETNAKIRRQRRISYVPFHIFIYLASCDRFDSFYYYCYCWNLCL